MANTVAELPLMGVGRGSTAPVPQEGRLEGTSIPELLCAIAREELTGALMLERRSVRKVLYLRDGRVVFAASSDPEDRLGLFLLRRGEVRLAPLLEASGQVARGRRLGQILVENGVMDPGAVVRAVLDQVREVALSVFAWREGGFRISKVALPAHESITLDLPMDTLILAGTKRVRDWRWVRRAVGGPRAAYARISESAARTHALGMTERAILEQLDGPQRVDTICREVYAPSYDVYRALWGLAIIGLIQREDPRDLVDRAATGREGMIPAGGVAALLLELSDRKLDCVLRLFHEGQEGALYLAGGRIQFATIADTEKSLVAHLLRRGVISDHDHDEAVRRLLSGKRIGTILAERGAIQPDDIDRFVREQLLDVTRTLCSWSEGEYTCEPAPTFQEPISLDLSVEDVVVEACSSLEAFDPVWQALGGLSTLYRLRRDYLDRLDRMTLRPAIWELVSLLGKERTIEELLAARPEPDFELCRLILGLERVGVIQRVSEAEILVRARSAPSLESTPPTLSLGSPDSEREPPGDGEPEVRAESPAEPPADPPAATALDLAPELFREEQHHAAAPDFAAASSFESAPPDPEWSAEQEPFDAAVPVEAEVASSPEASLQIPVVALAESQAEVSTESTDARALANKTLEIERPAELSSRPDEPVTASVSDYEAVDRFNRRHALVFNELRLEIGAGARNFVMTCVRRLGRERIVFETLEPDRQGWFEREALVRRVALFGSDQPNEALEALIHCELELVSELLPPSRRESLQRLLEVVP
jgi:hypothetical protein